MDLKSPHTMFRMFILFVVLLMPSCCVAFVPSTRYLPSVKSQESRVFSNEDENESSTEPKLSLEEKMKSWEASEEEIKAASLGGVVPGRSDAFDVGLYILFPVMVIGLGLFAFFPIIVQNIDINSVGPPPTS
ncbi:hypothetical protein ACHAW6_001946 [Cyclotella cf. meneghiniana]